MDKTRVFHFWNEKKGKNGSTPIRSNKIPNSKYILPFVFLLFILHALDEKPSIKWFYNGETILYSIIFFLRGLAIANPLIR